MSRRALIIGLLTIGLVTLHESRAEAHYIIVSGKLFYHSAECSLDLKGVANPDTKPAVTECAAVVSLVDTLCENPQNHTVAPGQAATQTVVVGQNQIDQGEITGKGKATVNITIVPADDLLGLTDEVCVNPNWHLIRIIVREVQVMQNVYTCSGSSNPDDPCNALLGAVLALASTSTYACVLPAEVDFQTVPPPEGIAYDCTVISSIHVK